MGWVFTLLASGGELLMIWGLKQPQRLMMALALLGSAVVTGYFLNLAFKLLDSSTVYPVWVSLGSLGSLLMGALLYDERLNKTQLSCLLLLIVGCCGLFVGGT